MVTVEFPRRITAVEARQSIWFQAIFFLGGVGKHNLFWIFVSWLRSCCVFILPEWMLCLLWFFLQEQGVCNNGRSHPQHRGARASSMPWVEGGGEKEVVGSFDEVKSVLVVSLFTYSKIFIMFESIKYTFNALSIKMFTCQKNNLRKDLRSIYGQECLLVCIYITKYIYIFLF